MGRRDPSWLLALAGSLLFHGLLAAAGAYLPSPDLRGPPRPAGAAPVFIPSVPDSQNRLGHALGHGDSASASKGARPMEAQYAPQSQAFLSLDPVGPGRAGDPPSESVLPAAPSPTAPGALELRGEQTVPLAAAFGLPPSLGAIGRPLLPRAAVPKPSAEARTVEAADEAANPKKRAEASGGATSAADPAPQADSESDPFSKTGSIRFRGGRAEVQLGREARLVPRPRIGLSGAVDLLTEGPVRVVLKLRIDESGNVTDVEVVRSGGTNGIDQPCVVAAYQWWFEPTRDRDGKPVPDVLLFTLAWY